MKKAELAATWSAVSSKAQDKADRNSLRAQEKIATDYCEKMGFKIASNLLSRESRSSKSVNPLYESTNSAYVQLIELCEGKKIQHFVYDRHDRVARDYLLAEQVVRLCLNNGVTVHEATSGSIIADWATDPLERIIKAYSANKAVTTATLAMMRGRVDRNTRGLMAGTPPYGYKHNGYNADGTKTVVVVPGEVEGVKRFYELYLSNRGTRTAALMCREEGYNITDGISYRLILNVWIYAGYTLFRRGPKRNIIRQVPVDKDPLVSKAKGQHKAIISEEIAKRVEKEAIRRSFNNGLGKFPHQFSSMIKCSLCKNNLGADRYYRKKDKKYMSSYRCNTRGCAHLRKSIAGFKVEKVVVEWLKSRIDHLRQIDSTTEYEEIESEIKRIEEDLQRLQSEVKKEDDKLLNIARRFAEDGNDSLFDTVRAEIEERREKLQSRMEQLENKLEEKPAAPVDRAEALDLILDSFKKVEGGELNVLIRDWIFITANLSTKTVSVTDSQP